MKTLTYAIRFLSRSKAYTIINLLGLAFSLACSIILIRYIHREMTVDTHCVDRTRVVVPLRDIAGNYTVSSTQFSDTAYISDHQIVRRSYLTLEPEKLMRYSTQDYTMNVILADSNFLQMFDYEALEGELELSAPHHALISEACAKRMFGNGHAVGKTLDYDENIRVTIGGVIKQPVCKTSLQFDLLLSNQLEKYRGTMELIQLLPDVDLEAINRVSNVYRLYRMNPNMEGFQNRWEFMPLKDFYFNQPNNVKSQEKPFLTFGSSDYLGILSIVATLLLLVGIMNFINLYMIYMMKRTKEYGIKKVFGLQKWPLFAQIWTENVILAFWALMFAWLIIEITQIPVSQLMGVKMEYTPFDIYLSIGFLFLLPVLTSIYPYIRHQYMSPITSMRAITTNRQSVATRMFLLSVQYVITFVLMVFSLYLNKHFQFLIHTHPGFEYEQVMVAELIPKGEFSNKGNREAYDKVSVLSDKLSECPVIEAWVARNNILKPNIQMRFFNEKGESTIVRLAEATENFFKVYGINMVEGEFPGDKGIATTFIPNEAAMKAFGYKHIKDAFIRSERPLGIRQAEDGSMEQYGSSLFPVEGVIKDYYFGHLTQGIQPMIFRTGSDRSVGDGKFYIRIQKGKEQEVVQYLKKIVMDVYGTDEISYSWMEEQVKAIYDQDRKVATIYTIFALIAIAIACLGLFGISLFDIRRRYREIAIRKAHGAGMKDLYQLLFKKYLAVLGASFVVAVPIAYYLIHQYTADFVVKAPIGIGIFVLALLLVAVISMGTLYWQIRKAANIDPATVMKTE